MELTLNNYHRIIQDSIDKNFMIIIEYQSEDLRYYIKKEFYNIRWLNKLSHLSHITNGFRFIHEKDIIHHDFY